MEITNICEFRKAYRNGPYAWPGGYPLFFIASDGAALSFDAVRQNLKSVLHSIAYRVNDGWRVVGMEINWEDASLYCEHSGKRIESAYGEDE
jgi:hypothetical protein